MGAHQSRSRTIHSCGIFNRQNSYFSQTIKMVIMFLSTTDKRCAYKVPDVIRGEH